jgi:hypothetical protein
MPGCATRLTVGKFKFDHKLPDALGGQPTLENCQVICATCDDAKTYGGDIPQIAKAGRQRAAHLGKPPSRTPLPCGRGSKFKRTLDGRTVLRKTT